MPYTKQGIPCAARAFSCAEQTFSYAGLTFSYAEQTFSCAGLTFSYAARAFSCAEQTFSCAEQTFSCAGLTFSYAGRAFSYAGRAFSYVYPAFNARPEGAKAPSPGQASEAMRHPGFRGVPSYTPQRGKSSDRGVFMRVPCVQRTPRRGKSSQPRASERSDATPWVSRRAVRYAPTGQKQRQGRSKLPSGRGGGRKTGPPPWSAGITGAAGMVGGRLWGEGARGGSGKMRREGAGRYHSSTGCYHSSAGRYHSSAGHYHSSAGGYHSSTGRYHSSAGRYHSSPNDFSLPNCSP